MDAKKLIEIRKEAEKSVADMPSGELKVKAFDVILHYLLAGNETGGAEASAHKSVAVKKKSHVSTGSASQSKSTSGRILVLKEEGFFSSPKSMAEVREELAAHGWHYPNTTLSGEFIKLVQRRELRRQKLKDGKKKGWKYSNS